MGPVSIDVSACSLQMTPACGWEKTRPRLPAENKVNYVLVLESRGGSKVLPQLTTYISHIILTPIRALGLTCVSNSWIMWIFTWKTYTVLRYTRSYKQKQRHTRLNTLYCILTPEAGSGLLFVGSLTVMCQNGRVGKHHKASNPVLALFRVK